MFIAVGDVFLCALHDELGLSAPIDHALPNGDYHVYTPHWWRNGWFSDIPLLNVWVGLKTAISRTTPSRKGTVAAAKCMYALVLLLILHFELINIVGLIGVDRGSIRVCGVVVSSLRVLTEPPSFIYRGIFGFGLLIAAARERVPRGHRCCELNADARYRSGDVDALMSTYQCTSLYDDTVVGNYLTGTRPAYWRVKESQSLPCGAMFTTENR